VAADPYLLYARAAGRWASLPEAHGDAKAQAKQAISDCKAALRIAQDTTARPLAASSALLLAQILAEPPLQDSQAAMKVLRETSDVLKGDKAVAEQAEWLHVRMLAASGLVDAAMSKLANLKGSDAAGSSRVLLQLADDLSKRHVGGDVERRRTVVRLCNRALAGVVGEGPRYVLAARRSARIMLRVGAHTDAKDILQKLLQSEKIKSDRSALLACSLMLAEAHRQGGRFNDAKAGLEKLAETFPASCALHMALGRVELDLKQPAEAVKCFRRARKACKPDSVDWCESTLLLAQGLHANGQAVAARDILRVSGALYPRFGNPELLAKLKTLSERLRARGGASP
ncbi:unnamed protein product, partial [marine sediment metagenome]